VITRFQPPLIEAADVASVQFSRTAKRRIAGGVAGRSRCRAHGPATSRRRSLKTQQHAGLFATATAGPP
jgi:hypothetical protein